MMRILTILVILAAAGWSGFWAVGRIALMRGVEAGVTQARADGWGIVWEDLSVAGFPNRFDTTALGLEAQSPDGWGVVAPRIEVLALSYRPNEVIVVPGTPLTVVTPTGLMEVSAEVLRASGAVTVANPPQPVRAEVETEALLIQNGAVAVTVARGLGAMREAENDPSYDRTYDLALSLTALTVEGVDTPLPTTLDLVEIDATATVDRPLTDTTALTALTLRRAEIAWDDTRLDLTGEITVGPSGLPEGDLTVTMEGWRALLPLLSELGLPQGQALLLSGGIGAIEQNGRVEIPLTLAQGLLKFGTIPLAPLPRLPVPYSP